MFRRVFFLLIFLGAIIWLLYAALQDPTGIEFNLFGYVFETSLYFIIAALLFILKILSYIFNVFSFIKYIFSSVIYFFTGKSKERAEKALLNAYAAIVSGRPAQARKYLKKCKKYYGDNPHTALIKLVSDKVAGDDGGLTAEDISIIDSKADLKTLSYFARGLYENDRMKQLELIEKSQSYKECRDELISYIRLALEQNEYSRAQKAIKSAQNILENPGSHIASINIILSHHMALDNNPEISLSHAQTAMKHDNNVIAFSLAHNAFKKLMRENKSVRLIHDRVRQKPDFLTIKTFLDMRSIEAEENMAKRISALPREKEKDDAFLALQAYHFAKYRDLHSLSIAVRYVEGQEDNDWGTVALLCLAVESDEILYQQALELFFNVIAAKAYEELYNAVKKCPELYHSALIDVIAPYHCMSCDVVKGQVSLLQKMIKHIPVAGHYNVKYGAASKISQDDVKQLYNGDFKNDDEDEI